MAENEGVVDAMGKMVNPAWNTPLTPQEIISNEYYRPPPPNETVPGQMTPQQYITNEYEIPKDGPLYDHPLSFAPRGPETGLYPNIFSKGSPSAGWFTLDDYYALTGKPMMAGIQTEASLPSTNDWRLLPPGFNTPDYFMVNGNIIDRRMIGPSMTRGDQGRDPPYTGFNSGASIGFPIAFTNPGWSGGQTIWGYPGSIQGWKHAANSMST